MARSRSARPAPRRCRTLSRRSLTAMVTAIVCVSPDSAASSWTSWWVSALLMLRLIIYLSTHYCYQGTILPWPCLECQRGARARDCSRTSTAGRGDYRTWPGRLAMALPARARTYPQAPPKLIGVRQHAGVFALGFRVAEPPLAVVDPRKHPVQRGAPGHNRLSGSHACRVAGLQHRQVPEFTVDLTGDVVQRVLDRQEVALQDELPLLGRPHALDAKPPAHRLAAVRPVLILQWRTGQLVRGQGAALRHAGRTPRGG